MKRLFKSVFDWCKKNLVDKTTRICFIFTLLLTSSSIWIPLLIAIITDQGYWYGIAGTVWAFWLGPFTPFWALTLSLAVGMSKIIKLVKERRRACKK